MAIEAGFLYGARLPPRGIHFAPYFCDQDWKIPGRKEYAKKKSYQNYLRFMTAINGTFAQYLKHIKKHRPYMATVFDWEFEGLLHVTLDWARAIAPYVEVIVIIPKVPGGVPEIPDAINGKPVRLGYSVPTSYGGTDVPIWEFDGRPVHLLGGSPHFQFEIARYLAMNVVSVDCNYHLGMATNYNQFFTPGTARWAKNRFWPTLREADGEIWGDGSPTADAPYEAFRRSCENIVEMWRQQ